MTRVALCGADLAPAAEILGLEVSDDRPDLILVDLADAAGVSRAAKLDPLVPRIVVPAAGQEPLLRALGSAPLTIATDRTAAAVGPLVARTAPATGRAATRTIAIAGIAGGAGRTLLAVNLARRLASRRVLVIDLTGSGRVAMWLGVSAAPWSELESLAGELTPEHVAVIAAERDGVRVLGGPGAMPSAALAAAATRAAAGTADLVIVDLPLLPDERALDVCRAADRVLLVAPLDVPPPPAVGIDLASAWLVASRGVADRIAGLEVFRCLPDDPAAVRAADRAFAGGALGRAYDELAEVIAVDQLPP